MAASASTAISSIPQELSQGLPKIPWEISDPVFQRLEPVGGASPKGC